VNGLLERLLASARAANLTILGFLVAVVVAFSLACPPGTFLSAGNVRSMALAASTVLVLGVGMTFLLIAGGLDLSVGAIVVFAAVAAARYLASATVDPVTGQERTGAALWERVLIGALIAIGVGLAWGIANGIVVTWTRVPPFVATLASSTVVLGLAQVWTNGVNVSGAPLALQERFGLGLAFGQVPWPVVLAVVVVAIGWVVLAGSRFGLRLYAIGANPEAARRAGVRVGLYQVAAYALVGLLAGMVAFTEVARFTTARW
jgi:ribose transport system permease protein